MRLVLVIKMLLWVAASLAVLAPAWAQTAATPHSGAKPSGHVPTRMQRCQSEVASLTGSERKRQLSECLVNRNEGERIVSRNCFRQYRDLPPTDVKIDKGLFIKECVHASLKAGRDKLPDRKAAVVAAAPASAAKSVAAKPVASVAPVAAKPASATAKPTVAKP